MMNILITLILFKDSSLIVAAANTGELIILDLVVFVIISLSTLDMDVAPIIVSFPMSVGCAIIKKLGNFIIVLFSPSTALSTSPGVKVSNIFAVVARLSAERKYKIKALAVSFELLELLRIPLTDMFWICI
jgi:hypothetical protein